MTKKAKRRTKVDRQRAVTDTFEEVEKLLMLVVGESVRQHGLEYDEVVSAVHWGFMQAFHSYTKEKGLFHRWATFKAKKRIQDLLVRRGMASRTERLPDEDDEAALMDGQPAFSVDEWLEELTDDARRTASLALTPPPDVKATVAERGDLPCNWRFAIRDFLRDQDWKESRIAGAFREVRKSL